MTLKYFAYGSNLHLARFQQRVPSAGIHAVAALPGHELRFHKAGADGSAKANAFASGDEAHRVHGVVYEMAPAHKALLDRLEGGYDARQVELLDGDEVITAFAYLAQPRHLTDVLLPFAWYKAYVHQGAEYHGLDAAYIERIKAHPDQRDPDPGRAAEHARLLGWV